MTILFPNATAARSCLSSSWAGTWASLMDGRSGLSLPIEQFPEWPLGPTVGMIRDWPHGTPASTQRFRVLLTGVLEDIAPAIEEARLLNPSARCVVFLASSHGDPGPLSDLSRFVDDRLCRETASRIQCDDFTDLVRDILGDVRIWPLHAACASGAIALLEATSILNAGMYEIAVIVGADALSVLAYAGFQNVGAMSKNGCQPFSGHEDGMSAAEGAVALLLMRSGCRLPEGPQIRVIGGSHSCDGQGIVEPSAEGLTTTVADALLSAAVDPSDVDFVYWHGTGTKLNDMTENKVSASIWRDRQTPIGAALKGAIGHTMGAAAAFNIAAAAQTIVSGSLPIVPYNVGDDFPSIRLLRECSEPKDLKLGLCIAMGFGGINAAVLLEKVEA